MTSLPPFVPAKFNQQVNHSNIQSAYERCLREEQRLMGGDGQDPTTRLHLISIRILGYLFHFAPTDIALGTVAKEIHSCMADEAMHKVGDLYLRALVRVFKAAKDRTPTPSNDASRPSFDTLSDMIDDYLNEASQSHAAAKKKALVRDGFRCVVTGKYDTSSVAKNQELAKKYFGSELAYDLVFTHCAHIFSESANAGIEPGSDKPEWTASMWAVMGRFGYTTLPDELNGTKIHRLENILTLQSDVHRMFDGLSIWFVATDIVNTYRIETIPLHAHFQLRHPTVTFTTTDPIRLPLPSPEYLAIHAACANVAHLSGASEWCQELDRDEEEHSQNTLDTEGNSLSLLHSLLWVHANESDTVP